MVPRDIVSAHRQHDQKKPPIEDDHTFLPPALSSYSIALLNDKTPASTKKEVTGIYDLDFPDKSTNNKLKQKLSIHFKDSMMIPDRDVGYKLRKTSSTYIPPTTTNHSITASQKNSNHNTISHSPNNSMLSSLSGNTSTHSYNSHNRSTHNHEEKRPNSHGSGTSITRPLSGSSSSDKMMPPVKRLRVPRKFGTYLGAPQRVSRTSSLDGDKIKSTISTLSSEVPTKEFEFGLSFLDKEKELELRERIEQQKKLNELEAKERHNRKRLQDQEAAEAAAVAIVKSASLVTPSLNAPAQIKEERRTEEPRSAKTSLSPLFPQVRKPLNEVPPSNRMFRKPRLPKSNFGTPVSNEKENVRFVSPQKIESQKFELPPAVVQSMNSRKPVEKPQVKVMEPEVEPPIPNKRIMTINNVQYEKLELIGRGGTSKVYKVRSVADNKLYAVKRVTFDQFDDVCIREFKGEIDLLLKLKSNPRVVQLIDYTVSSGSIYLVMECGEIDLAHVFHNKMQTNAELDVNFVRFYATELLKCVQHVHEAGIVHSDLKPANFLVVRGSVKLIDFGIANAVPEHTVNVYRDSQIGTPSYMAPETLTDINHTMLPKKESDANPSTWRVSKPSDVWSCGCIIYQMIYGKPPYGSYTGNQRILAILNPQIKIQYPSKGLGGKKVPISAIELIQNCLQRFPDDRWTVEQCLSSDFLKPKIVTEGFIRKVVHLAVDFGFENHFNGTGLIPAGVYDDMVETVLKQIEELNFS